MFFILSFSLFNFWAVWFSILGLALLPSCIIFNFDWSTRLLKECYSWMILSWSCHYVFVFTFLSFIAILLKEIGFVIHLSEKVCLNRGHWLVLIDAAKGCATDPPDLTKYKADFLVISFYKVHPNTIHLISINYNRRLIIVLIFFFLF